MGRHSTLGWFSHSPNTTGSGLPGRWTACRERSGRPPPPRTSGANGSVYVAQGVAQRHQTLMLDEPLTGLDLVSARTIDAIIHSERDHGHAVILTTHDLDEARAADHVILMSGRVVASGRPSEVLTRRNLEIAYGLGALHESGGDFIDDPGESATD